MIVKSPFKDYYDFVAKRYGGGDPRVVYARDRLAPCKTFDGQIYETHRTVEMTEFPFPSPEDFFGRPDCDEALSTLFLVVAGKLYLIARMAKSSEPRNPNTYRLQSPEPPALPKTRKWRWNYWRRYLPAFGKEHPQLIELSRLIQAPVFAISGVVVPWRSSKTRITICGQCPILGTVGFPSLISPFEMYQDLAYFVGNTMKPVPDTEPPVEVSNREKILKAGFDLRQSFRHRVR